MEEANTLELTNVRDAVIEVCSGELNHAAFQKIAAAAFGTEEGREEVAQLLASWETFAKNIPSKEVASIVQGYFLLTLGDGAAAEEVLRSVKRQPWGAYHLSRALEARNRVAEALAVAEEALEAESGSLDLKYLVVDLYLKMRRTDEAGKILDKLQKAEGQSPQYQYHRGCYLESTGDYEGAIQCYREAVNIDGNHADALFRLGFLLDIHGTDADDANDEALSSFENCVRINPVHTNAVVNLGVLYEDRERYHDAIKCYETVLRILPNHERARLYLGDAQAATQMFYDKEQEKKADKQSQVLKIPVSDFELSVRSRNCLQKMNIQTLGDLILKTEQELLSYKNFGETSLAEIKEMLSQKGLRLGQAVEGKSGEPVAGRNPLEATASQEVLGKPIEELNLSVRSRRCMERLEVRSIRDLINKTEMELMAAKNFGMTSLNEIKRKLGDLGLSLRS